MDKKTTGIVAYITWIGLLIAFLAGDKEGAKFHLNQSLVIWLVDLVGGIALGVICVFLPIFGILVSILHLLCVICAVIGFIGALNGEEKEVPVLGQIKLLK